MKKIILSTLVLMCSLTGLQAVKIKQDRWGKVGENIGNSIAESAKKWQEQQRELEIQLQLLEREREIQLEILEIQRHNQLNQGD